MSRTRSRSSRCARSGPATPPAGSTAARRAAISIDRSGARRSLGGAAERAMPICLKRQATTFLFALVEVRGGRPRSRTGRSPIGGADERLLLDGGRHDPVPLWQAAADPRIISMSVSETRLPSDSAAAVRAVAGPRGDFLSGTQRPAKRISDQVRAGLIGGPAASGPRPGARAPRQVP